LAIAFWSATGYVGAYMRAANSIHQVREERPLWKLVPLRIFVTAVTGLVLALSAFAIFFSGRLAVMVGHLLGVSEDRVKAFDIVKWPVLVAVFIMLLALLYWISPHGRADGFQWLTQGSVLATVVWLIASSGFAFYVSWFDSFNRTYGTLGGVIIFLVWMWLTNIAVLLGADFDAELRNARAALSAEPDDATVGARTPAGAVHAGDRV
jgi:membrane protein